MIRSMNATTSPLRRRRAGLCKLWKTKQYHQSISGSFHNRRNRNQSWWTPAGSLLSFSFSGWKRRLFFLVIPYYSMATVAFSPYFTTTMTTLTSTGSNLGPLPFQYHNPSQHHRTRLHHTKQTSGCIHGRRKFSTTTATFLQQSPLEHDMTDHALQIVKSAIDAVNPYTAIRNCLSVVQGDKDGIILQLHSSNNETTVTLDLSNNNYDQILVVAFGKASSAMATAVLQQLDNIITNIPTVGLVIGKDGHATKEELYTLSKHNITFHPASHPVPDERGVEASQQLMDLVQQHALPTTLTIALISGGGSALFCQPQPPLTLDNLQKVNTLLLSSGMDITQMNVIRKKLEVGKGGGLLGASQPSALISLILSDVVGDPLDLIASGPTVPDPSTYQEAMDIVCQYGLSLPLAVVQVLQEGLEDEMKQAKQQKDDNNNLNANISNSQSLLVGNNALSVQAAANKAQSLGYHPVVLGTEFQGEAQEIAKVYVAMARYLQNSGNHDSDGLLPQHAVASKLPVALIAGGETTVTLPSINNNNSSVGKGGRNQELALSAALQLEALQLRNIVVASVGTDGGDGPTDAAGAVVDGTTIAQSKAQALQALAQHNAYPYFNNLGKDNDKNEDIDDDDNDDLQLPNTIKPLIKTGPTGTNVADICVTLIHAASNDGCTKK